MTTYDNITTIHHDPLLDGAYKRIEKLEQDVGSLTALVADMHIRLGAYEEEDSAQ